MVYNFILSDDWKRLEGIVGGLSHDLCGGTEEKCEIPQ
jgi:hypothetical protein